MSESDDTAVSLEQGQSTAKRSRNPREDASDGSELLHQNKRSTKKAKLSRQEKYQSFILLYHAKDAKKSLLDPVKVEASTGVEVARIRTIRAAQQGLDCVALMSTTGRYRLKAFCELFIPEEYNKVDRSGLQIMGSEGLCILCNDLSTRDDYKFYDKMIKRVVKNQDTRCGTLLGDWTREDWENHVEELEDMHAISMHEDEQDNEAVSQMPNTPIPTNECLHVHPSKATRHRQANTNISTVSDGTAVTNQDTSIIGSSSQVNNDASIGIPEWLSSITKKILDNQEQLLKNQEQLLERYREEGNSRKQEHQLTMDGQAKTNHLIESENQKLQAQITSGQEKLVSSLGSISADQKEISQNHLETSFLIGTLETTTLERNELQSTVRSQAGKMSVVSKKLNAALKENAELVAEREKTVERQAVIDAVADAVAQVNQNARRAEERIADALQIDDQPLGNPGDNFPYSQWIDPLFSDFKKNLEQNYKKAPKIYKRDDLPPMKDFPDSAKSRLFHLGIGLVLSKPQNFRDLDNSPAKHRHDLARLSGRIYHEDTFNLQKESFETQVKCLSDILCRPYVEDQTVYPMIQGDPFRIPEMLHWKLDQHRGAEFNKFKKNTFDEEFLEIPKYSDDVWWRYFTTLHMTGTAARITRDEHIVNLDRIQSGRYYSEATMNAMEAHYLERIAELKRDVASVLPDDKTYENAVKIVVHRAKKKRQHYMSTRPKIANRTGRRSRKSKNRQI